MGELAKRASDAVAAAVGDTVNPVVAALLASAAVVTRNPELIAFTIPTGALAGAATEQGFLWVRDTLRDRADRVQEFADTVTDEVGQPVEDFIAQHVTDGAKRELLGRVVAAATDARTAWKITVLAKAFVQGAKEGDLVDETLIFVKLLEPLDPGHARILAVLHKAHAPTHLELPLIVERDPGVGSAALVLLKHLMDMGLVRRDDRQKTARYVVTELGSAAAAWLQELGAEPERTGVAPGSPPPR